MIPLETQHLLRGEPREKCRLPAMLWLRPGRISARSLKEAHMRCESRRVVLAVLLLAVVARAALAVPIDSCGAIVPEKDIGVLVADLACPGPIGVTIRLHNSSCGGSARLIRAPNGLVDLGPLGRLHERLTA